MSLDATAKLENVKASLESYLYAALVTQESLAVRWEGADLDTIAVSEWAEPRVMVAGRRYLGRAAGGTRAHAVRVLLNINLFARQGGDAHRLHELRDLVAAHLTVGTEIPLSDHAGGGGGVGALRVEEIVTDRSLGEVPPEGDAGLRQYNFSVALSYLEQF